MIAQNILVIEDELILGEIIKESLETRGFTVELFTNGKEGLLQYFNSKPSLIVLDVMLPDADGLAIARQIRLTDKEIPIIFLTAKSLPQHVVKGFESGGNDYLKKPFSLEELIVRIKVLLSKYRLLINEDIQIDFIELGEYHFYSNRQLLNFAAESRKLSSKESELLKLLYLSKNSVIDRKIILLKLWNDDHFFNSRSLDVYISKLRKYLNKDDNVQIINYRGIGYKFIC